MQSILFINLYLTIYCQRFLLLILTKLRNNTQPIPYHGYLPYIVPSQLQ